MTGPATHLITLIMLLQREPNQKALDRTLVANGTSSC